MVTIRKVEALSVWWLHQTFKEHLKLAGEDLRMDHGSKTGRSVF